MSDQTENGDVWIHIAGTNYGIPAEYFSVFQGSPSPHAVSNLEVRFNLTAYVRDMIAEAVK